MAFNLPRPRTQGTGPAGMNEPTFRMERPRTAEFFDRIGPRFIPDQGRPAPMPMPLPDRGMPLPAPMPMPDREFDFRRNMPMPATPTAYVPGDDYGSFIPDSVLEMDRFGADYGPADEYEFDRDLYKHRIRTPYIDDIMPDYYYRGGIASLLR